MSEKSEKQLEAWKEFARGVADLRVKLIEFEGSDVLKVVLSRIH
jgi:hypothetical protein